MSKFIQALISWKIFFIFILPLSSMMMFQNCSGVNFDTDESAFQVLNSDLELENGFQYTNKKIISVKIKTSIEFYKEMKISMSNDFSNSPSLPVKNVFQYDLDKEWAADGSKDGIKTFYVELSGENIETKVIHQNIGLDTVHPNIKPMGVLASGLQGNVYSLGERVNLDWLGEDIPAPTGFSSGLDPSGGLKFAHSETEDCSSSQVTVVQPWGAYKNNIQVGWPQKNPLDSLYFCIYVKDRAGNFKQLLSQPMTSLWKVIVGENSQGNGGDSRAPNIRFKSPTILEMDAQGNLFIGDRHFNNLRVVQSGQSDSPGEISLFWGNGKNLSPKAGDSLESTINGAINGIVFDEENNIAFVATRHSGIYEVTMNAARTRGNLRKVSDLRDARITLREYNGVKTILIYHIEKFVVNDSSAQSYLYEIPWGHLSSTTSSLTVTDLAPYRIAGNGAVSLKSYTFPQKSVLGLNTSASDNSQTLDRPGAIETDDRGNIYLASTSDGVSKGWGHHLIKRLTPREDGKFDQEIIGKQTWIHQMEYHDNKLYISGVSGFAEIDLQTLKSRRPLGEGKNFYSLGVHIKVVNNKPQFFVSHTLSSRVAVYDSFFNLSYFIGRPVYQENEPNALLAMVGQSDGVLETPEGDLIYVDSLSHTVRKVSAQTGQVTTLLGSPNNPKVIEPNNTPFSQMSFNGSDSTANSYLKSLIGDFSQGKNILYMGTGAHGSVISLDLNTKTANTVLSQNFTGVTELANSSTINKFRIYGLDIDPDSNSLIASRAYVIAKPAISHSSFTGFLSKTSVTNGQATGPEQLYAGDLFKGKQYFLDGNTNSPLFTNEKDIGIYTARKIRATAGGLMYSSDYGGFNAHDLAHQQSRAIKINGKLKFQISTFEVFNEGDTDTIIYPSGLNLMYFKLSRTEVLNSNKEISVTAKKLCLPGTFLNRSKFMAKGADNNLIISDTDNGRILKYFISSSDGYKLQECQ